MADMNEQTKTEHHWEKIGTLNAGVRLQIIVGTQTVYDKTVPAGKAFKGRISIDGEIITL